MIYFCHDPLGTLDRYRPERELDTTTMNVLTKHSWLLCGSMNNFNNVMYSIR